MTLEMTRGQAGITTVMRTARQLRQNIQFRGGNLFPFQFGACVNYKNTKDVPLSFMMQGERRVISNRLATKNDADCPQRSWGPST